MADGEFDIVGKYEIRHVDGTPLHGKQYFVLRLDSDSPDERASVSAAMNAYLGNDMKNILSVLDRCHAFISRLCRDDVTPDTCLEASDLADDVYDILHPESTSERIKY